MYFSHVLSIMRLSYIIKIYLILIYLILLNEGEFRLPVPDTNSLTDNHAYAFNIALYKFTLLHELLFACSKLLNLLAYVHHWHVFLIISWYVHVIWNVLRPSQCDTIMVINTHNCIHRHLADDIRTIQYTRTYLFCNTARLYEIAQTLCWKDSKAKIAQSPAIKSKITRKITPIIIK